MDRSAVVLAGGFSSWFEEDKALLELKGKPLIRHVVELVDVLVDEVVVVADSHESQGRYAELLEDDVKFAVNASESNNSLAGALAGFEVSQSKWSLLLSSDMPFASPDILDLLFELCHGRSAAIPRWSDQQIEPLQAVYHTKTAFEAAQMAAEDGEEDVDAMIENMGGLRYVSTLVIREMDPELRTFFRVNTPLDLKRAEGLLSMKPRKRRKK
ncbi:MAG: NTP transferase domain-containing protein [Candidatus Bathyarchaeota archaeon]|nr:NTP transferase domain-containing protein [Candidatus Bathyarchaeota archaeon]